jgi:predicted metalloprotease with PDZ domain
MDVWSVTEYFANLSKSIKVNHHWRRFYNRLSDQMERAMNDTMSLLQWVQTCWNSPTKINTSTYIKRSLIGMCLDIIIREKAKEKGILDLMQNLLMNMVFQNHLMIMNFC